MRYRYFDDDDDKERKEKLRVVYTVGSTIREHVEQSLTPDDFGLCSTCTNFQGVTTRYGKVYGRCVEWLSLRLDQTDPVTKCTLYEKRGALELEDFKEMATLIDPDKKSIGFVTEEE